MKALALIDGEHYAEVVVDALTEWLNSGHAAFFDDIHETWRLRRDYGS